MSRSRERRCSPRRDSPYRGAKYNPPERGRRLEPNLMGLAALPPTGGRAAGARPTRGQAHHGTAAQRDQVRNPGPPPARDLWSFEGSRSSPDRPGVQTARRNPTAAAIGAPDSRRVRASRERGACRRARRDYLDTSPEPASRSIPRPPIKRRSLAFDSSRCVHGTKPPSPISMSSPSLPVANTLKHTEG